MYLCSNHWKVKFAYWGRGALYSQLFLFASKRTYAYMDLICFIFACFGIFANTMYSHHSLHICFKIFAQICIQIFNLMQNKYTLKQISLESEYWHHIFSYQRIFAARYSFEANICKTSSKFHIPVNICWMFMLMPLVVLLWSQIIKEQDNLKIKVQLAIKEQPDQQRALFL